VDADRARLANPEDRIASAEHAIGARLHALAGRLPDPEEIPARADLLIAGAERHWDHASRLRGSSVRR
jgi:hypothetical protein